MSRLLIATLLTLAMGLTSILRVGNGERAPQSNEAARFADDLLDLADRIHDYYYREVARYELLDWAVRGLYLRLNSKMIDPDISDRLSKLPGMEDGDLRRLLVDVYLNAQQVESLSSDRLQDLAIEEMTKHLDAQTRVVYGPSGIQLRPATRFYDIGLKLEFDTGMKAISVLTPVLGGPAYKVGIRSGDQIARIAELDAAPDKPLQEPHVISTKDLSLGEALRLLTGEKGTRVRIGVTRLGVEEPVEYSVVRDAVSEETVLGLERKPDDQWDYWIDRDRKVAYIRILDYNEDTPGNLDKLLDTLQSDGLAGLILDLRFSSGASVDSSVAVADLLIDDGVIMTIRSRSRTPEVFQGKHEGSRLRFQVACLVNHETAKLSEVVAACLQDHRRAVIMGERTKGCCSIQSAASLKGDGRRLSVTTALIYRPSNRKIDRGHVSGIDDDEWGVSPASNCVMQLPDEECRALAEHLDRQLVISHSDRKNQKQVPAFKDRQLEMAIAYLRLHLGKP